MNAAVALARLGTPVRFCGVVGNDGFGAAPARPARREGVDTTSLRDGRRRADLDRLRLAGRTGRRAFPAHPDG